MVNNSAVGCFYGFLTEMFCHQCVLFFILVLTTWFSSHHIIINLLYLLRPIVFNRAYHIISLEVHPGLFLDFHCCCMFLGLYEGSQHHLYGHIGIFLVGFLPEMHFRMGWIAIDVP